MTAASHQEVAAELSRTGRMRAAARLLLGSAEGKIGIAILTVFLLMVILGPWVAPYGATEIGVGLPDQGPSAEHPLGTDGIGRDVLSRLLVGARSVIGLPLLATTLAFVVGGLIGLVAGYVGGRVDGVLGRAIDILVSLPPLLIVLVIIAALGGSNLVIVLSVAIVYAPRVARIIRGATQGVVGQDFIQAAQARGERVLPIVVREVLPNIKPTVAVEYAVRLTYVIIFIVTLNFLGVGARPPSPNWGLMVAESRSTVLVNPIATVAPTVAIGLLCVGIGLVADAATRRLGIDERSEILR